MKLYSWLTAPNPRRAKMFVREKNIDIEIVEASDPDDPGQLSAEFCERHPHRRVPLLELHGGDWIGEATAICRYLETIYPENSLLGRDAKEAAQIEMWDRLAEWEGMMAVSEVFRNTHRLFVGRGLAGYDVRYPRSPILRNGENYGLESSLRRSTRGSAKASTSPATFSALPISPRSVPSTSRFLGDS